MATSERHYFTKRGLIMTDSEKGDTRLERIREALKDRRLAVVADACGLHYNTLRALRDGEKTNPTYTTMSRLEAYLGGINGRSN
tara:strand:- start:150 stop:401 length:252 start_codon:yes stop_codon:yes gene_type:complete